MDAFVAALWLPGAVHSVRCCNREFSNGTSSRPDVVAIAKDAEVIAIEAKLARWRDAMQQAYRNAFFADRSYVLLPPRAAARAMVHIAEFRLREVGILSLVDDRIVVFAEAPRLRPYNIYRRELAREHASAGTHRPARLGAIGRVLDRG